MKKGKVCQITSHFALTCLAVVIAMLSVNPQAHARDCFREHLRKATVLNRTRRPLYSALSDGRSTAISNDLIFLEELALLSSHFTNDFDRGDQVYQTAGIEVLCEDFVSMDKAPPFQPKFDEVPALSSFRDIDTSVMKARLNYALDTAGFSGVRTEAELWLAQIAREPHLNCMLRHTLDSIVRIATLAPEHSRKTRALGLPDSSILEKRLIRSHWTLMGSVQNLDRAASKLQAAGLPIICRDVPPLALPN